jgi:hypothetical protein
MRKLKLLFRRGNICQGLLLLAKMDRPWSQYFTGVKEILTLLVNARRSISNAMGVSFSRGMYLVSLTSKHRI